MDSETGEFLDGTLCKISLIGPLDDDPALDLTVGGDLVTSFSLTTINERGGIEYPTRFYVWVPVGEDLCMTIERYLRKGRLVFIRGPLTWAPYTDAEGRQQHRLQVRATELRMLDRRPEVAQPAPTTPPPPAPQTTPDGSPPATRRRTRQRTDSEGSGGPKAPQATSAA